MGKAYTRSKPFPLGPSSPLQEPQAAPAPQPLGEAAQQLHEASQAPAHASSMVLPKLCELEESTGLWPAHACSTLSAHGLHQAAWGLLGCMEAMLCEECVQWGWHAAEGGVGEQQSLQQQHPLHEGFAERVVGGRGEAALSAASAAPTALCMPASRQGVGKAPHCSHHRQGYVLVYFGRRRVWAGPGRGWAMKQVRLTAHHVVCWLFRGPPPPGCVECGHLCGYTNCLNPHHLVWVSKATNTAMAKFHEHEGRGVLYPWAPPPHGEGGSVGAGGGG